MRRAALFTALLSILAAFSAGLRLTPMWIVHGQSGPSPIVRDIYASYRFNVLKYPTGLAVAGVVTNGTPEYIFIADSFNNIIREFQTFGPNGPALYVIAGTGVAGYADGPGGNAQFNRPTGIDIVPNGVSGQVTLNVSDAGNNVVRQVCTHVPYTSAEGGCNSVQTVAGTGTSGYLNGPGQSAQFSALGAMLTPDFTTAYMCDAGNNAIRMWDGTSVSTFAGTGTAGLTNGYRTAAKFNCPTAITWDTGFNLYVADMVNNVIRKIDTLGNVTTFAGSGQAGYADGGPTVAKFNWPCGMVYNPADHFLYVADSGNNMIRRIDAAGNVTTFAGARQGGLVDGTLSQARFQCPMGIALSGLSGTYLYVSDAMNNVIRRIDMTTGIVSTYIS